MQQLLDMKSFQTILVYFQAIKAIKTASSCSSTSKSLIKGCLDNCYVLCRFFQFLKFHKNLKILKFLIYRKFMILQIILQISKSFKIIFFFHF